MDEDDFWVWVDGMLGFDLFYGCMGVDDMAVMGVEGELVEDVWGGWLVLREIVIRVFVLFMGLVVFNEIRLKGCDGGFWKEGGVLACG